VKRALAVGLFGLLGFASVLLGGLAITWTCEHFGGLCRQAGSNCPIDNCTPHGWHTAQLLLFYFGPAAVFAVAAFIFGRRPRPVAAWALLAIALITLHALWMFAVTYA
jgi:hypothetical protein